MVFSDLLGISTSEIVPHKLESIGIPGRCGGAKGSA